MAKIQFRNNDTSGESRSIRMMVQVQCGRCVPAAACKVVFVCLSVKAWWVGMLLLMDTPWKVKYTKLYKKGIYCEILLDALYDKKYYSSKPKNNGLKWL